MFRRGFGGFVVGGVWGEGGGFFFFLWGGGVRGRIFGGRLGGLGFCVGYKNTYLGALKGEPKEVRTQSTTTQKFPEWRLREIRRGGR